MLLLYLNGIFSCRLYDVTLLFVFSSEFFFLLFSISQIQDTYVRLLIIADEIFQLDGKFFSTLSEDKDIRRITSPTFEIISLNEQN